MAIRSNCALCDTIIDASNNSTEHIILNAIGGRKKIPGFICKHCNEEAGHDWDSALAEQLQPLCLFFGIIRDRGTVPPRKIETTEGNYLQLNTDGSMTLPKPECCEEEIRPGVVQITIKARSIKEARAMATGIKRKYPQIDTEALLQNVQNKTLYPRDWLKISLSFGGLKAGRSLTKSALALALNAGIDPKTCERAINYLSDEQAEACFGYYYAKDLLVHRPQSVPLHCVAVKGNTNTKQLLGYVEFFGVYRMILCLSDHYEGEELHTSYAVDPRTGTALNLIVDLALTKDEVRAAFNYERIPAGSIENAFSAVIPPAIDASQEREKTRVRNRAVEHALRNCVAQEGESLLPEHVTNLAEQIANELCPFILHQLKSKRKK